MRLIAYDGKRFADLNVDGGYPDEIGQSGPGVSPIVLEREGMPPIHVGMRRQSRIFTAEFVVIDGADVEQTRIVLLGALRCGDSADRVMVAAFNDGTEVECLMKAGQWRMGDVNSLFVDFHAVDDRWQERVATTLPEVIVGNGITVPLNNEGGADVQPELIFGWDTQRLTDSATVGWRYVTQETITNSGTRPWRRVRKTVDLGDTAALVTAGKMLANGDDLRVRIHGTPSWMEIPRTLTNVNTKRTFCHFYVTIPAGQSVTYDFCYGNPSATAPETLSVRTVNAERYAADDLEGDNGTATSGGASTLTDSGKSWETNRWRYGYMQIVGGTGSGQKRRIASNTPTQITVERPFAVSPNATSEYVIWMSGIAVDAGLASAGTTGTTTDSSQNWNTDQWKGATLTNAATGQTATVTGNTATVLTHGTITAVAVGAGYRLERYGVLNYMVNNAVYETDHRGLYRLNKYHNKGGRVWYGDQSPGGWIPWLMLHNQDDKAQGRYVDEGSGGGHAINNRPSLYARRSVRSDNTWPEKSQADGLVLYDPRAFIAIDFDYQMKNEGGIGEAVLYTQEPDGDDWQTIASDSTTRASLAPVTSGSGMAGYNNLTGDQTPVRIYLGVLPADGVEIPSTAKKHRSIELRSHSKMIVYLDVADCGAMTNSIYVVGSETEVYDLQAEYRIGGGANAEPPYDRIVGNVLLADNRELRINPNLQSGLPLIGIYNASTGALVERAPMAATIYHHELNLDGDDTGVETKILTPLPPGKNLVPYPDSVTGWTLNPSVGVTATLNDETSTTFDGNGQAIGINIASAPVGAWSISLERAAFDVIPGALYEFGAVVRSSITGIDVSVNVEWQETEAGGATSIVDGPQSSIVTIGGAARWYPLGSGKKIHAGSAITEPTGGCNLYLLIEGTGNVSGNIYIDPVTLGSNGPINMYVTEDEPGELTFSASWRESWHG